MLSPFGKVYEKEKIRKLAIKQVTERNDAAKKPNSKHNYFDMAINLYLLAFHLPLTLPAFCFFSALSLECLLAENVDFCSFLDQIKDKAVKQMLAIAICILALFSVVANCNGTNITTNFQVFSMK